MQSCMVLHLVFFFSNDFLFNNNYYYFVFVRYELLSMVKNNSNSIGKMVIEEQNAFGTLSLIFILFVARNQGDAKMMVLFSLSENWYVFLNFNFFRLICS